MIVDIPDVEPSIGIVHVNVPALIGVAGIDTVRWFVGNSFMRGR